MTRPLRVCLHLTKRKVLSLTKPKGKIYKTKSLGHYITRVQKTKKMSSGLFKNVINEMCFQIIYNMYKQDLALNKLDMP